MKSLTLLAAGSILYWGLLLTPCWLIWGDRELLPSATALALCLLPALASLAWLAYGVKSPEMQVAVILGGSGIRMAVALTGGFLLGECFPETYGKSFVLWLGAMYLGVLAFEVGLAMKIKKVDGVVF